MKGVSRSLLFIACLSAWALAPAQEAAPWSIVPDHDIRPLPMVLPDRDSLGLPGARPRLTMAVPYDQRPAGDEDGRDGAFSWSLETWQLNTASLAHIQCNSATLTIDSYLARDCRFVDQPLPDDSVNLVQVRGDWSAAPGLNLGFGAFRSQGDSDPGVSLNQPNRSDHVLTTQDRLSDPAGSGTVEGVDFNVSFGIHSERVGEFLIGLQVARYRQRMSLQDLGLPIDAWSESLLDNNQYTNSAKVMLGWRRGSFSGEMLGQHRESPLWLGSEPTPSAFSSFDLEFSWHPLRNSSLSVGVSNVLDAVPRSEDGKQETLEDPNESVYGRIPYVRYKHDL